MRVPVAGGLLAPRHQPEVIGEEDVPSESLPDVWYTVQFLADGTRRCNCPDFRIRRAPYGEDCKHILRVVNRTGWSRVRKGTGH